MEWSNWWQLVKKRWKINLFRRATQNKVSEKKMLIPKGKRENWHRKSWMAWAISSQFDRYPRTKKNEHCDWIKIGGLYNLPRFSTPMTSAYYLNASVAHASNWIWHLDRRKTFISIISMIYISHKYFTRYCNIPMCISLNLTYLTLFSLRSCCFFIAFLVMLIIWRALNGHCHSINGKIWQGFQIVCCVRPINSHLLVFHLLSLLAFWGGRWMRLIETIFLFRRSF